MFSSSSLISLSIFIFLDYSSYDAWENTSFILCSPSRLFSVMKNCWSSQGNKGSSYSLVALIGKATPLFSSASNKSGFCYFCIRANGFGYVWIFRLAFELKSVLLITTADNLLARDHSRFSYSTGVFIANGFPVIVSTSRFFRFSVYIRSASFATKLYPKSSSYNAGKLLDCKSS